MEHDTDQLDSNRQQTQCRPKDSQGVGGSEDKTPDVQGDDNPSPTPQNFSELEKRGQELAGMWSEALDRAVLDSYLYGVGMVRVSGEDGLGVDIEHIDWWERGDI